MQPAPTLDNLVTPIAWADLDGRLTGCNAAFAGWLEMSPRRLIGAALAEIDGENGALVELLARLPADGSPLCARRLRLRSPAAGERFADLWLTREAEGFRIEVHQAEEFLGEDPATALPAAAHAALKGLAHEIRNPLSGLRGAAQLLARRIEGEDARELVGLMQAECDRLGQLVDRLLNPTPPRPFAPTNIHQVLERVRVLAEAEAGWAVKLERDYDPSLPELVGDADRLVQALWNLVRNALESGAGTVVLRTRAERHVPIADTVHRLALRVEIADDGRGVSENLTERIFLPLVSGRADGTGLGLPLAQQIAREHGGALSYRSRPGHTVFTLLLPAQETAAAGGPPTSLSRAAGEGGTTRDAGGGVRAGPESAPETAAAGSGEDSPLPPGEGTGVRVRPEPGGTAIPNSHPNPSPGGMGAKP